MRSATSYAPCPLSRVTCCAFVADSKEIVAESLGRLRLYLGEKLELIDHSRFQFAWIVEWPLLERDADTGKWNAAHHPFTSPVDEDVELLSSDPARVRAKAYDLVLNGVELGGGSIRIHRQDLQEKVFEVLGLSHSEAQEKFGFCSMRCNMVHLRTAASPWGLIG